MIRDNPFAATFVSRGSPSPGLADSTLLVLRHRYVGNGMREDIELHNLASETTACYVTLLVDADFADIFEVKDNRVAGRGDEVSSVAAPDGVELRLRWMGRSRGVRVVSDTPPRSAPGLLTFPAVVLPPRSVWRASLQVHPVIDDTNRGVDSGKRVPRLSVDTRGRDGVEPGLAGSVGDGSADHALSEPNVSAMRMRLWRQHGMTVRTESVELATTLRRSDEDLGSLRIFDTGHPDRAAVAAGAPWFMTLFGRDSILASWMSMSLDPQLALGTLQTLADYQGLREDPLTEEQPGRILHEIRSGLSSTDALGGETVYYGTVDATPLFVMLLAELHRWGVRPAALGALMPAADRALDWVVQYGDRDGDGFVEYRRMTDRGLVNQGWKDSWDGVNFADGAMARAPIALCEVQGYVYAAYLARARLARDAGDDGAERSWTERARQLKAAFNEQFWLPERGYFAVALDGEKRPVDALSSNIGHCLWTGIVDDDKAASVAEHLLSPQMFSGWGVRTLAASMAAYNPMSYHNGSVWPHDNALIAAGLMRYGFVEQAQRVAVAVLEAAARFEGRLPELFCGFDRDRYGSPVPYPTSCSPQAWAAAAPIHLLRTLLRWEPDVPAGTLHVAPALPPGLLPMRIERLPLAGAQVSVTLDADGGWEVDGVPEQLTVVREPAWSPVRA